MIMMRAGVNEDVSIDREIRVQQEGTTISEGQNG
jgi:hypothetical protein